MKCSKCGKPSKYPKCYACYTEDNMVVPEKLERYDKRDENKGINIDAIWEWFSKKRQMSYVVPSICFILGFMLAKMWC